MTRITFEVDRFDVGKKLGTSKQTVEIAADGVDINTVRDELLIPLLLAAGFHPDTVNELFGMDEEGVDSND